MSDDLEKSCHQELAGVEGPMARKLKEQADRIEQLEAALREIEDCAMSGSFFEEMARKALEGKNEQEA